MIYEIEIKELPNALQRGANVLIISADGLNVLVKNISNVDGLNILDTYQDSQYAELVSSPFWRQPCPNC